MLWKENAFVGGESATFVGAPEGNAGDAPLTLDQEGTTGRLVAASSTSPNHLGSVPFHAGEDFAELYPLEVCSSGSTVRDTGDDLIEVGGDDAT